MGKPYYGKRSLTKSNINRYFQWLPFPVASISTILFIVLVLSTLLALFIGAHRNRHDVISIDIPPNLPSVTTTDSKQNNGNDVMSSNHKGDGNGNNGPSIRSFQDLTPSELHPQAGPHRHIVSPPPDEIPVTLVTCSTTAGYLHVLVHPSWAPLGAGRFLQMVKTEYFSSKVALMRCMKNFLCQFGIAGDPPLNKPYGGKNLLEDDPNWLPEGPKHRSNELGVKRFGKGYMAYAGAGKNSRSNQLIVALNDNERLGGGSPWEVPWGELVGEESFRTLDKIYTGYGEKGPSQGRLRKEGSSEGVRNEFPKLDYILSCDVTDS